VGRSDGTAYFIAQFYTGVELRPDQDHDTVHSDCQDYTVHELGYGMYLGKAHYDRPPAIAVTSPGQGDRVRIGSGKRVAWTSFGVEGGVKIEIGRPSSNGYTWTILPGGDNTDNDGSFDWTAQGPVQAGCKVRVSSVAPPSLSAVSAPFYIMRSWPECVSGPGFVRLSPCEPRPQPF
jgi:hypothetical protein